MDVLTDQRQAKENILTSFRNFAAISNDNEFVKASEANPCSYRILQNLNTPQTLVEYLSEKLQKNSRANKPGNLTLQPSTSLHKKSEICGVLNEPQCAWKSGKQRLHESRIRPLLSSSQSFYEDTYSGYAKKKPPTLYKHLQRNVIRKPHEQKNAFKNGTFGPRWMKTNMKRVNLQSRDPSSSNSDSSVGTHMCSTAQLFKAHTRERAPGRYIVGRHFHNLCKNSKIRTNPFKLNLPPVTKNKLLLSDHGLDKADYKNNERLNFIPKLRLTSQHNVGKPSEDERKHGHEGLSLFSQWLNDYKPKKIKRFEGLLESGESTREESVSATTNEDHSCCSSSMSSSKPLRTALRNNTRRKRSTRKRFVHFDPRIAKYTPTCKYKRYDRLKQSEHNNPPFHDSELQPRSRLKKQNSALRNAYKDWGLSSSSETMPLIYTSREGSIEDVPTKLSYRRLQSDDESMK